MRAAIGVLKVLQGLQGLKGLKGLDVVQDVARAAREEDRRLAEWAGRCGEQRAREAMQVARTPAAEGIGRSKTLPELLAEAYLRKVGVRFEAQVDLGWAVPDFVVFTESGVVVWRIQGEYWHGRPESIGRDMAQKERLLAAVVRGQSVRAVVDVWEADIYAGEAAMEQALKGVQLRG